MDDRNAYYKILKALWRESRDASAIAREAEISTKVTVAYLDDLLKKGYVVGDGNPMGFYAITDPGRYAGASSTTVPFELFAEKLGQQNAEPKTVMVDIGNGCGAPANKVVLNCGCIAWQMQPPDPNRGLEVVTCSEEHARALELA